MSRPVSDLNLSVRARKCMSRLGITTLHELVQKTQDELLESKNFGVTSLTEVRQKLTDLGLKSWRLTLIVGPAIRCQRRKADVP